jgi:hypothetical protein
MKNWGGLRHLSIEKKLNVPKVLIDSDREKNSASNEHIFIEFKSDFYGLTGQKLVFGPLRKSFGSLLLYDEF